MAHGHVAWSIRYGGHRLVRWDWKGKAHGYGWAGSGVKVEADDLCFFVFRQSHKGIDQQAELIIFDGFPMNHLEIKMFTMKFIYVTF